MSLYSISSVLAACHSCQSRCVHHGGSIVLPAFSWLISHSAAVPVTVKNCNLAHAHSSYPVSNFFLRISYSQERKKSLRLSAIPSCGESGCCSSTRLEYFSLLSSSLLLRSLFLDLNVLYLIHSKTQRSTVPGVRNATMNNAKKSDVIQVGSRKSEVSLRAFTFLPDR